MTTELSGTLYDPDPNDPGQVERFEALCAQGVREQPLPVRDRTDEERRALERKVDWFYRAKFGVMGHFLPNMARFKDPGARIDWTPEMWSRWVDAVDVEAVADQAAEIGAGYFMLSVEQQGNFYCAPNPVYEGLWGFRPYEYASRRDLPADLERALRERGIPMMLYITGSPAATDGPALAASERLGWEKLDTRPPWRCTDEASRRWAEAATWWVAHYRGRCAGYWIDGLANSCTGHNVRFVDACRRADPEAIVASWWYALSDYMHGHCTYDWQQQQGILPEDGRWRSPFGIQWHAFQFLGHRWGGSTVEHTTDSIVGYARNVVERGGVITLDYGIFDESERPHKGPDLTIPEAHMEQLRAIREAVGEIER